MGSGLMLSVILLIVCLLLAAILSLAIHLFLKVRYFRGKHSPNKIAPLREDLCMDDIEGGVYKQTEVVTHDDVVVNVEMPSIQDTVKRSVAPFFVL